MVEDRYRELERVSDEIARCGRCGFCQEVCPVYLVSADEAGVARGRNMYARELAAGRLDLSPGDAAFFTECLLCRACVDMCFSAVKTDDIVLAGRRCRQRLLGPSPVYKYIFERVLPDHRKLGTLVRALRTTRQIAPAVLFPSLKIFGWLGVSLLRAEQIAAGIPREFLRERLAQRRPPKRGSKKAMYFIGCGINFMFPHTGEATDEILRRLDYDVTIVEHGCCGLPAFSHGDLAAARHLALANIEAFADDADSMIVTDCSSCGSYLKDYPTMLAIDEPEDEEKIARAQRFASRVKDITEVLAGSEFAQLVGKDDIMPPRPEPTVTFHEPCHLGRYQHLGDAARSALRSLPGVDFVEMKEAAWCCGGAGSFAVEHPELSVGILDRKVRNIVSSRAGTVATTCPACMMQIRAGITRAGSKARVRHISDIARDCLKGQGEPDI
jgi:glycolate oxidase iron-sulfur subunit